MCSTVISPFRVSVVGAVHSVEVVEPTVKLADDNGFAFHRLLHGSLLRAAHWNACARFVFVCPRTLASGMFAAMGADVPGLLLYVFATRYGSSVATTCAVEGTVVSL